MAIDPKVKSMIPVRQSTDLTPEERVARGEEARRLLENPLMREAFVNVKLDLFEAFSQCDPADIHRRDMIFHANRVIGSIESFLRIVMQGGQIDKAQIDKIAARSGGKAV